MKSLFRAALMLALFAVTAVTFVALTPPVVIAYAQTTVTSTAPSETTVNVGQLLAPWLQGLIAAVVSVIMALFGWLTIVINKRAGWKATLRCCRWKRMPASSSRRPSPTRRVP